MATVLSRLICFAPVLLVGCAAVPERTSGAVPAPGSSSTGVASAEPAADADAGTLEPAAQRRARIAEAKRDRCGALASTIEQERRQPLLVNINDARTLLDLAGELDEWADRIDKIEIVDADLSALKELRDKYTGTTRAMARALTVTADASGYEERKAPLGEFRELDPRRGEVLAGISEYCNAPAS